MTDNRVSLILKAIEVGNVTEVTNHLDDKENQVNNRNNEQDNKALDTHDYVTFLHAALEQAKPSYEIIKKIIEGAREYKDTKKQNRINTNGIANGIGNHNIEKNLIHKIINSRSENETKSTPLQIALERSNPSKKIITLLLDNGVDINYTYSGPSDKAKQRIQFDNYLHIAARTGNTDAFLLIFKKSIEKNVCLLGCNEDYQNPFHLVAPWMLPTTLKGMFEYLQSEVKLAEASILETKEGGENPKEKLEKLESLKETVKSEISSIKYALYDKVSTDKKGLRPVDRISGHLEKEIRKEVSHAEKSIKTRAYSADAYEQDETEVPDHILFGVDVEDSGKCRIM